MEDISTSRPEATAAPDARTATVSPVGQSDHASKRHAATDQHAHAEVDLPVSQSPPGLSRPLSRCAASAMTASTPDDALFLRGLAYEAYAHGRGDDDLGGGVGTAPQR